MAQTPVFPGAHGFGSGTVAGRGGTVHRVTNLSTSGPGSLKNCVSAHGPRVCIFEISGTIALEEGLQSLPYDRRRDRAEPGDHAAG
jgi:hypothetical protein